MLKHKFIIKCKGRRRIPKCFKNLFTEEELKSFEEKEQSNINTASNKMKQNEKIISDDTTSSFNEESQQVLVI